jgi:hypothetical protein
MIANPLGLRPARGGHISRVGKRAVRSGGEDPPDSLLGLGGESSNAGPREQPHRHRQFAVGTVQLPEPTVRICF